MVFVRAGDYLSKFKSLESQEERARKAGNVLAKIFPGVAVNVAIKKNILHISTSNSAVRNEVFIRKREILEKLEEAMGKSAPSDISFQKL
jgi:hypothetical protein